MTDAPEFGLPRDPRLGDLLREARESRGLELSEIAQATHVRRDYLAALEEGRYSDLPEDVYTKNFLRLFAQAVGVDVVRAQELYRSERRDSAAFDTTEERLERENEIAADVPPVGDEPRRWERRGGGPRWGALASTLLMVVAVVALALWGFNSTFFNPSRGTSATNSPAGEEGAPLPAATNEPAPAESGDPGIPRTVRLSVSSVPPGAEVSVDGFPLPGTTPIESAPVTARPARTIRVTLEGFEPFEEEFDLTFDRNLSVALSPEGSGGTDDAAAGAAGADGTAATPGEEGAVAAGSEGQVVLDITEDTWLEVYSGTARNQGERLAFATVQAGQRLSFPLPVYIHVGNAGGVELTVDGQERGQLGSSGEVRGVAVTE